MDPLSITAACLSIAGVVTKLSKDIIVFIRAHRDAREDLAGATGQLAQLKLTLDLLGDESGDAEEILPKEIKHQITSGLSGCQEVLVKLGDVLVKYRGRAGSIKWALWGKDRVIELNTQLTTHTAALNLALELSTLAIAKRMYAGINSLQFTSSAIDQRTAAIHHDTRGIRDDLARVVVEIEALRDLVIGGDGRGIPVGQQRTMEWVDRYVVSASSYAETVCDDIEWSDEEYQTMLETLTVISGPSSGPPAGPGRMRATGVQFASKAAEKSSPSPAPPPRREIAGLSEDLVACLESAVRRRGTGVLTGDASDLMFEISGHCAAFVPHGRTTMLAVNGDGHIAFHDARTGYLLAAAVVEDLTTTTSSRPPQFSPDGSLFALVVDSGGALYVNDSPRSRPGTAGYTGLANQQIYETGTLPAFVAFSMNNRLMVSGSINGSIDVWERKRGEPRFKKKGRFAFKLAKSRVVHELAVSPCGKFVVAAIIPNEFGVNRPASGIAIQIYSLAKNKFGRLVGEPYREDAESSYSFLHFHHWDGELVASLWYCPLNCNMHGLSLLDVDPQAKTLRFSKRAPPDDIDFKTFVEHYDGATRRDLTNIGKAAGRYCVAFCMDEQQRDEEAVHIYQWDRDWGRTSAGDARTNLRCPSFSSDLSLLLVQAVGGATSSYEVWLLPTQFE